MSIHIATVHLIKKNFQMREKTFNNFKHYKTTVLQKKNLFEKTFDKFKSQSDKVLLEEHYTKTLFVYMIFSSLSPQNDQ